MPTKNANLEGGMFFVKNFLLKKVKKTKGEEMDKFFQKKKTKKN